MFRSVQLPDGVDGVLFVHSMPGRFEEMDAAAAEIRRNEVTRVICLTQMDEVRERSPDYAAAIEAGVSWTHVSHPVPDFGVPEDGEAFMALARSVAEGLHAGERVLVHCAAGIGRTGTFAAAVLCELGVPLREARKIVRLAGSTAETDAQQKFLEEYCVE